jgi:uncharacterized protein YeaO (DUF488 family)
VKRGKVCLKRAYDPASPDDGYRILVERLWPRGLTKEKAAVDLWLKEIAPSPELRKWFGHDPQKWQEFSRRYQAELDGNPEAVSQLGQILEKEDKVTFVYAARDTQHNSALLLKDYLERSD